MIQASAQLPVGSQFWRSADGQTVMPAATSRLSASLRAVASIRISDWAWLELRLFCRKLRSDGTPTAARIAMTVIVTTSSITVNPQGRAAAAGRRVWRMGRILRRAS